MYTVLLYWVLFMLYYSSWRMRVIYWPIFISVVSQAMAGTIVAFHWCQWSYHDDVIKWKHYPRYWPFVRGIHGSRSPQKCQWRGALMYSLICVRINGWVNNREAGDLRRYRAHYDVTIISDSFQVNIPVPKHNETQQYTVYHLDMTVWWMELISMLMLSWYVTMDMCTFQCTKEYVRNGNYFDFVTSNLDRRPWLCNYQTHDVPVDQICWSIQIYSKLSTPTKIWMKKSNFKINTVFANSLASSNSRTAAGKLVVILEWVPYVNCNRDYRNKEESSSFFERPWISLSV